MFILLIDQNQKTHIVRKSRFREYEVLCGKVFLNKIITTFSSDDFFYGICKTCYFLAEYSIKTFCDIKRLKERKSNVFHKKYSSMGLNYKIIRFKSIIDRRKTNKCLYL